MILHTEIPTYSRTALEKLIVEATVISVFASLNILTSVPSLRSCVRGKDIGDDPHMAYEWVITILTNL